MDIKIHILNETMKMFSKYGIRSVTMDNIASDLGISKRTLYEIFKDKDDLVFQSILEGTKEHQKMCSEIVKNSSNIIEAIYKIANINSKIFEKINPLFFDDLKKYHFEIYKKIHDKGDIRNYEFTKFLFLKGLNQGIIRDDVDIDLINVFVHKLIEIFHDEEMVKFNKIDILKTVFIPYFEGISTEKGRELINKYFNIAIFKK